MASVFLCEKNTRTKVPVFYECIKDFRTKIIMASPETALKSEHRKVPIFASKSYDPMEYATTSFNNNIHYEEQFDIEKTRPLYKGGNKNDIRHSMLAYTDYVTQRQKRNKLFSTTKSQLLDERKQLPSDEVCENLQVQATHIPNNACQFPTPDVNGHSMLRRNRIPLTKRDKVVKYHSHELSKSVKTSSNPGLERGNTFPPLTTNNTLVNSQKVVLSSRADMAPRTKEQPLISEDVNNDVSMCSSSSLAVNAWDIHEKDPKPVCSHSSLKGQDHVREISPGTNELCSDKGNVCDLHVKKLDTQTQETSESDNGRHETGVVKVDDGLKAKRREYSEKLLKNAIETLKLMEKQLDSNRKKDKTVVEVDKFKDKKTKIIKLKKIKRLKLPKQNLDIIPELDCEYSFTSKEDIDTANKFQSGSKITRSRNINSLLNRIEESSDEDSDLQSMESEHSETDVFKITVGKSVETMSKLGNKNHLGQCQFLPPISHQQSQCSLVKNKAKKSKAKSDIKTRIKNKSNKLFYLQQQ